MSRHFVHLRLHSEFSMIDGRVRRDKLVERAAELGLDPIRAAQAVEQIENRRLGDMIVRAGYPGIAADLDMDKVMAILPAMKKKARELQDASASPEAAATAVNAGMERLIRQAPGQYLWSYARYKQPAQDI